MNNYYQGILCIFVAALLTNTRADKGVVVSPAMSISYRVVDDIGHPLQGVSCRGWIREFDAPGGGRSYSLLSDTNGIVTINGKCSVSFTAFFTKNGYYRSRLEPCLDSDGSGSAVVEGKWQPYGETRTVVLKRIIDPWSVVVFDERFHRRRVPVFGVWIGYDLECGDWLPPFGKGKHEDVLLRFKSNVRKRRKDYNYAMDISFTNNPYAGAYLARKDSVSDLKSERQADTNAIYQTMFSYSIEYNPNNPIKPTFLDADSYLVFRTRTEVDDSGRLIGAHYGKIYGIWRSTDSEMLMSDGCFNPSVNDPNIEGDWTLRYTVRNYNLNAVEYQGRVLGRNTDVSTATR